MVALQHLQPAARSAAVPCRAQQQQAASPPPAQPQQPAIASRRRALAAAVALPAAAAIAGVPRPAAAAVDVAAEAAAAADVVAGGAPAAEALDVLSWPQWVDRTFSFSYPPGWKELDPSFAAPPPPRPGSGACQFAGPVPGLLLACSRTCAAAQAQLLCPADRRPVMLSSRLQPRNAVAAPCTQTTPPLALPSPHSALQTRCRRTR